MKLLSKYNIQVQLVLSITIVFVICGIAGVLSVYQKTSNDRNQEQISAVRESLHNFERLNLGNFETYDYHEIFRNLNQYQFPSQTAFIVITDKIGNVVTERWMSPFVSSPAVLKTMRREVSENNTAISDISQIDSEGGYLHFIMPIMSGEGSILARIHLFLDFSQIKQHTFHYGLMLVGLLILCLTLILVTVIIISRRVMRPIAKFYTYLQSTNGSTTSLFDMYHDFPVDIKNLVIQYNTLISNLKKSEDIARCQAVDAAIGKTATHVAHDIRSPLSSMQAALMMLRKQCGGNKDAKDYLDLLQLSSARLEGISNGLLAKYKGQVDAVQVFSVHEVLDELIGELQASPIGKNVKFEKRYYNSALYVSGDRTAVARAFGNVIKNALEAMGKNPSEKPKQLVVTTACHPERSEGSRDSSATPQNDKVCIRITDTGPGIPADKIPLILQGGHTEGKTDGHGIGTKVVCEVIDAHKGELSIESEVGKGTTFVITLPMADIAAQDSDLTVTVPYSGSAPVFVIDDEPSMREQWRLTLKALGAEAKTYTCWEDINPSLATLPQNDKNCTFVVDYHFDNSEIDGVEIIRRLKERGFNEFVLATAEYWKPAIKDAAKELNITLCPKPLPKVVLAKVPDSSVAALPQNDKGGTSVLLIDDDADIQTSWRLMKGILGVGKLTMYSTLEDMIAAATNPADYDICIIDKNIDGSQYNGAKMLAHLKENGAHKVFLATGEAKQQIEEDPQFATIDGIITEKVPMSLAKYLSS